MGLSFEENRDRHIHIIAKIEEFFEPFIDVIVETGGAAIILIENADTKMQISFFYLQCLETLTHLT